MDSVIEVLKSMDPFERLNEAFLNLADAAAECANALFEAVEEALYKVVGPVAEAVGEQIENLKNEVLIRMIEAYIAAENEHPDWVHMAKYNKKKRIRKKYHDRIMRTYGG